MTTEQALKILKQYQSWRRGEELAQPHQAIIGAAIDIAIDVMSEQQKREDDGK